MNAQQLKNAILQDVYSAKDGWNIKELKDVVADSCPISYGIVQQGNHVDGGVPVVRPVDLHTKYVGKANLKCTSKDISDSYKRTVLNGNEVLLCVRGTTGIVALATEELKGCNVNRGIVPLFYSQHIRNGRVHHKPSGKQFDWIVTDKAGLIQKNKNYVFCKRFTAKEEKRRLQCGVYLAEDFPQYEYVLCVSDQKFRQINKSSCVSLNLFLFLR